MYSEFGKIIYDGELLNDQRNGKGKEYNKYGEIQFIGEFINGQRVSKQ